MAPNPPRAQNKPSEPQRSGGASRPAPAAAAPRPMRGVWRLLISVALLAHLAIVIAVPLQMVPPQSRLAGEFVDLVSPYVDIFQVSHGYAFFGPDPGNSHLLDYELEMPGGQHVSGRIPDLKSEWPRLRYHRYFMLAEKLANERAAPPPGFPLPPEFPPGTTLAPVEDWEGPAFRAIATSYADHLLAESGASRVRLFHVEHLIPGPDEIRKGMKLNDPSLFLRALIDLPPVQQQHQQPAAAAPEEVKIPTEAPQPESPR